VVRGTVQSLFQELVSLVHVARLNREQGTIYNISVVMALAPMEAFLSAKAGANVNKLVLALQEAEEDMGGYLTHTAVAALAKADYENNKYNGCGDACHFNKLCCFEDAIRIN
jgi:hypothetical protein